MRFIYPVLAVVVVIALVLTLPVFDSSKADFSTYNTAWNGCSQLKALSIGDQGVNRQTVFLRSLGQLNDAHGGVLVMLNPSASLTNDEIAAVNQFVENGGALLLANDFGRANAVLAGMGVDQTVRFNGTLLRDDSSNWWSSEFPLVFHFADSGITNGVGVVYLNYATALDVSNATGGTNVTVLAESAPSSYLGKDVQLAPGQNSSPLGYGEKPVLASLSHGKGVLVVCSDPSILINYMLDRGDNERLYTNLVANLTGGNAGVTVYFDESHNVVDPFWVALYDTINANDLAKYGFILTSAGVLAVGTGILRMTKRRRRPDEVSAEVSLQERVVVDDMLRRNPLWNRSRVELLLRNIRTRRKR